MGVLLTALPDSWYLRPTHSLLPHHCPAAVAASHTPLGKGLGSRRVGVWCIQCYGSMEGNLVGWASRTPPIQVQSVPWHGGCNPWGVAHLPWVGEVGWWEGEMGIFASSPRRSVQWLAGEEPNSLWVAHWFTWQGPWSWNWKSLHTPSKYPSASGMVTLYNK